MDEALEGGVISVRGQHVEVGHVVMEQHVCPETTGGMQ